MRRRGRLALGRPTTVAILLVVCGCGESNAQFRITIPDGDDVVFLLELDSSGGLVKLGSPHAPTSTMPELAEAARESELFMLALSESDLSSAIRSYDRSRWGQLELEPKAPESAADLRDDPARIGLPDGARLYEVDLDTEQLLPSELDAYPAVAALGLAVPTDEAFCRHLQPSEPRVLDSELGSLTQSTLTRLTALGDGRFLGLAGNAVYLIDPRDGSASSLDQSSLTQVSMTRPSAIAVQPLDLVSGEREIWIAGGSSGQPMAWRLTLDAEGLSLAETATLTADGVGPVTDGLFDDTGALIFVGQDGAAFLRRPGMNAFEAFDVPLSQNRSQKMDRIISTGIPEAPHLIAASLDTVLLGDVSAGSLKSMELRVTSTLGTGAAVPRVTALAAEPGKQLWAAGRLSLLSHYTSESGWRDVHPALPRAADTCTEGNPFEELAAKTLDMVYAKGRVYFLLDECAAVFVIDLEADCTAALPLPGIPLRRDVMFTGGGLLADGDELFIGARDGSLFVLDL